MGFVRVSGMFGCKRQQGDNHGSTAMLHAVVAIMRTCATSVRGTTGACQRICLSFTGCMLPVSRMICCITVTLIHYHRCGHVWTNSHHRRNRVGAENPDHQECEKQSAHLRCLVQVVIKLTGSVEPDSGVRSRENIPILITQHILLHLTHRITRQHIHHEHPLRLLKARQLIF